MVTHVLTQEFIATEWQKLVLEAIDGLQAIERRGPLSRVEKAALEALERAYFRTVKHRGAVITRESICRPLEVAHAAMERAQCAR